MSLQNFSYFLFLAVTAAVYLSLPKKAQTPFLFAASVCFYGFSLRASWLGVLAAGGTATAAAFRCAVSVALVAFTALFVWRTALGLAASEAEKKGRLLRTGIVVLLAVLAVFKYYNLSPLPTVFHGSLLEKLPFPLGISFFTFAALSYLIDVARGDCPAEPSFVHTATYLFFFATVTSGPICRGGQILPQLHEEHRADAARTVRFLRLFAIGLFEKVALADMLGLFVDQVFGHTAAYGAPMLVLAVILYTFQLYFDFAGYSNMARASGLLLGIELPENFKTPFFATNFSGFWARWHMTLSNWLQDYLFMPLAWADVGKTPLFGKALAKKWEHFPVEFCVFVVFFASGFWHGNTVPFVVWGLLQAFYRVGEELLHRRFGKPKKKGVSPTVLWGKRAGVFFLWAFSMIFFRIGSGADATLSACGAYLVGFTRGWSPARFGSEFLAAVAAGFYDKPIMELAWAAFSILCLAIGFYLDAQRFFVFKGKPVETVLAGQKPAVKWILYYALVLCIFAGLIIQNGGFGGGTSFAYAGF
jgi:alginate O-acetyltransferase complex protein AlgI